MSDQVPRHRLAVFWPLIWWVYARLIEADEVATLAALGGRRTEILQPLVTKHHGRVAAKLDQHTIAHR